MKILLLADGSSVHAQRYKAELIRQGVEVILVSLERGEAVDINLPRVTGINSIDYMLASCQIKKLCNKYSPDLINPHFAVGYGFMTALSGIKKHKPVLLHCLGSDILVTPQKSFLHRKRAVYALSRADRVLVDSEYLGSEVKRLYPEAVFSTIFWGADAEAFDSYENKSKNQFKWSKRPRIIVPRPHYSVYNNSFIIEALYELINSGKISITFPDWGDLLDEFKGMVNRLCPGGGVQYYRHKSREEFNQFISDFDVYLSASKSDSSPASLIEAMAAGLYPVVGDVPGVREWVSNINGSLYNLKNIKSLSEAVSELLDNDRDIGAILKNNNEKAKSDGVFTENIRATINLMEEMIAGGIK